MPLNPCKKSIKSWGFKTGLLFFLIFALSGSALAQELSLVRLNLWRFRLPAKSSDSAKVDLKECQNSTMFSRQKVHRPLFGKDKADHFMGSAFLTGMCFYFAREEFRNSRESSIGISLSIAGVIGISKEVYDKVSKKGTPSLKDLFADGIGIAAGILLIAGIRK